MADKNFLLLKKLMYVCSNKSFILRKMILAAVLLLIFPAALFAKGITLTDHTKIKELSTFRVTGEYELRTQKSPKSEVKFCTLNHEGGMEVRVLEIFEKSEYKGKNEYLKTFTQKVLTFFKNVQY